MKRYCVRFTEHGDPDELLFYAEADDFAHAEEQCLNAYPGCDIRSITKGISV